MSKKPILIIDLRPIQDNNMNGVTIASKNWIQAILDSKKLDVILWSNSRHKPNIPKTWTNEARYIHTRIPNKLLNLSLSLFHYPRIDKLLKIKANKYFCPDLRPFSVSNKILSHIYIHDIAFIKDKNSFSLKSRIWYTLIRVKNIYKNADIILTNSNFSKFELESEFGPNAIKVIQPILSPEWYEEENHEIKQKYFICISTLQKRKNLKRTIEGFNKFNKSKNNKYKLVIIGGHENTFKKIQITANNSVVTLGQVNEKEKKELIKKSSGLAYLSTYEGFGLPVLETIKLSRPALVSQSRPFTELYNKSVVYCDPYDTNSIQKGFTKLATTKSKKDIFFDYSKEKNKLLNVLLK